MSTKSQTHAFRNRCLVLLAALLLFGLAEPRARADALTDKMAQLSAAQVVPQPLDQWKFHQPDVTGGEAVGFDDSAWQTVAPGFVWQGENTKVWFRTRYVVPETINGVPTRGTALRLDFGMDDDGEVYVNGKFLLRFNWDAGQMTLTEHAVPGQVFVLAVRGINGPGTGGLRHARLVYSLFAPIERYAQEAQFVDQIAAQMPPGAQARVRATLHQSEGQLDMAALEAKDYGKASASLVTARKTLLALAPMTRQYDVYYVGHAHIDMNWLWTWPETIDVCHRTWDSAMHLMDLYPDFGFVQSQPGAYSAIQQQFPAEFAQMQAKQKRGQWDLVGGLYDESDTNMPSGEGLARSLFLGQRFFKTNFGQYATTGWLPDSFGHSWQLPQLMQEAGMENFYHMRCGDGIRYSWWQSPDGSRVLKANTDSYDEPVTAEQLSRPWQMERSYGLKEALVVFGVGDHGGGPTREMIDQGKVFQSDPLFPKVHFVTADAYFQHLRTELKAKNIPVVAKDLQPESIPVVDTDLQYTFTGCYTSHADLKKAVRSSENNLYAGEVFSSLAAMQGQPYPAAGFTEAWKPTAFAQFHDIMCGTAIHSTYDWMHAQLAPAFAFEQSQTDKALASLTAHIDTQGVKAGEQAVVVWNPLSFSRTDAVKLTVDNAANYTQARDAAGNVTPVQALDARTLVFVAPDVPAFGHKTYFLTTGTATTAPLACETTDSLTLENGFVRATVAKDTGLVTSLYDKQTAQEMIAPGQSANLLQVLGDSGSAWDIGYTGEQHPLTTGADVKMIAAGPVCAIVRVTHTFGKSTFTQDVTLYNNLPRIDVPTTVEWHEHGQLLKVAFPLAMQHPTARVGIPYGSIERPTTGQENPGQKWMDVSEVHQEAIATAMPLDLSHVLNSRSAVSFDSQGRGYPAALMPAAGRHSYGAAQIPFQLAGTAGPDNIACDGQAISVPAGAHGDTLYVLGAGALGSQSGTLTLAGPGGKRVAAPFSIGDWVVGGGAHSEDALALDYRLSTTGAPEQGVKPHLWLVPVPIPAETRFNQILLPRNANLHIFALTLGTAPRQTPLYGLTVLNDSKYGSDTNGNVFRLTLLRSSHAPDPNPDEGTQTFTYSLLPHAGDWRTAQSEQAGLALNIPLRGVLTTPHPGQTAPAISVLPSENLVVGALKHCEDGPGYILHLFETQGRNTTARLTFSVPVQAQETDLLERPIHKRAITVNGRVVTFPVGHDQIVTLRILGLPDAGVVPSTLETRTSRRLP
ncbi:MAG: glycosyl hydrolase-related protein [Armatimonadota bacterium]|nr:glycosyl hydrolase-related protein [Armatimonadota bacterium]